MTRKRDLSKFAFGDTVLMSLRCGSEPCGHAGCYRQTVKSQFSGQADCQLTLQKWALEQQFRRKATFTRCKNVLKPPPAPTRTKKNQLTSGNCESGSS